MLWICGDSEGLFLESLLFQEMGNTCAVGCWDGWKYTISCVKVTAHNGRLVLQN